jgi:hypothetical protein
MRYRVIALDPGGTTGWAMYSAERMEDPIANVFEYYNEQWTQGQLGPEPHHAELLHLMEMMHVESYRVVCESFEFRGGAAKVRDNLNLDAKEYIGVVKLFAQERKVPTRFQTAAMGKGFITDDKIKRAGLWHPGWRHAMDAQRHLLYYLVNIEGRRDLARRWWKPSD